MLRHGDPVNWASIRWSVKDLGGMNGTCVNRVSRGGNL